MNQDDITKIRLVGQKMANLCWNIGKQGWKVDERVKKDAANLADEWDAIFYDAFIVADAKVTKNRSKKGPL